MLENQKRLMVQDMKRFTKRDYTHSFFYIAGFFAILLKYCDENYNDSVSIEYNKLQKSQILSINQLNSQLEYVLQDLSKYASNRNIDVATYSTYRKHIFTYIQMFNMGPSVINTINKVSRGSGIQIATDSYIQIAAIQRLLRKVLDGALKSYEGVYALKNKYNVNNFSVKNDIVQPVALFILEIYLLVLGTLTVMNLGKHGYQEASTNTQFVSLVIYDILPMTLPYVMDIIIVLMHYIKSNLLDVIQNLTILLKKHNIKRFNKSKKKNINYNQ